MSKTLTDLNEKLFGILEKLTDENLDPDEIEKTIKVADTAQKIGETIIKNSEVSLKAFIIQTKLNTGSKQTAMPAMLTTSAKEDDDEEDI